MATVTGNAKFFTGVAPGALDFTLILTPSGPGYGGASSFWGPPAESKPDSLGNLSWNVQATIGLTPHVWYTVSARWLDSAGNFVGRDFPGWRVEVPNGGGNLSDLITVTGLPNGQIWYGPEPPEQHSTYTGWIDNSIPVPATGMPYYEWE